MLLLTLVYASHTVDRGIIAIIQEPLRAEFGLSDQQLGMVSGLAWGLSFAIAGLPLGLLVDRLNRRNLLASLLATWSAFTALCGLALSFPLLLVARAGMGAAESGASPTALSLIADLFPPQRRAMALGALQLGSGLGVAFIFFVGGWVTTVYGWRTTFFAASALGFVLVPLLMLQLRDPCSHREAASASALSSIRALGFVVRKPAFFHMVAGFVVSSMVVSGVVQWAASFFIRVHGMSLTQAAPLTGLGAGLLVALGALSGGALGGLYSRGHFHRSARWCALVAVLSVPPILGMALASSTGVASACFLLWAFVAPAFIAPANSGFLEATPSEVRGMAIAGIQLLANFVGVGVGSFIVGLLSDAFAGPASLRPALAIAGLGGFWSAAHFLLAARARTSR
ncbi:MAG: MFS transporter [Gammaproteobacteria bacterium]|nr:MFS transporter [Gammaproteobacteria bacterium]